MRELTAFLIAVLALAGCVETAPDAPTSATDPTPSASAASTDADPRTEDPGLGSHAHDYWSGRERVTLVDEDVSIEPPDLLLSGVMTTRFFRDPSLGGAFIVLPNGSLVYEGTGRLEIVATWDDATVNGLRFIHRHAGSGEIQPWTDAPNGETVSIEVTPDMTDMPHAQVSRWIFFFAASGTPPVASGTFHLRIDIVKTRDVAEWPAHPDHWNGASEILLVEADGSSIERVGPTLLEEPWKDHEDAIPASAIVPMEATMLRVNVTVVSTMDPAGVGKVHLLIRTASNVLFDYDDAGDPIEVSDDKLTWTWEVPIEMDETDNPYATTSAWAFRVRAAPAPTPQLPFCEHGCYQPEFEFRIVATVHRAAGGT